MIAQVASSKVVQHQIEILTVLKRAFHIDDEGTVQGTQNFLFVKNRLHTLLENHPASEEEVLRFGYFLHGVAARVLAKLNFPYLTESSRTNLVHETEGVPNQLPLWLVLLRALLDAAARRLERCDAIAKHAQRLTQAGYLLALLFACRPLLRLRIGRVAAVAL